ncbi:MAG: hypothetical protein B6I35_08240 [Anaerolineaceae bacterium 4572_32.2]|nr:MAG: hypothetical protein B6I35_08240 [Anaerolineaceae bacterium 4572_32.2]HEY72978.1 hypothetical protein [Thermoflexia bacterium]
MDFPQLTDLPVIDDLSYLRVARLNVVCTPHESRLSLAPDALPVLSGRYRRERSRQCDTMMGCQ